jgi:hypothetical protein
LSWYLPDGQWKQLLLPVHALYVPVVHVVHACDVVGWSVPTGQSVQAGEPAMAKRPLVHEVHELEL